MGETVGGGGGGDDDCGVMIGGFWEGAGTIAMPLWGALSRIGGWGIHRRGMGR